MTEASGESRTYKGKLGGLRWEAESCPDATSPDTLKATAGGGLLGFGGAILMGLPPQLRLVAVAAGAIAGALASRYHLNLDWDPDFMRDSPSDDDDDVDELPLEDPQPL